MFSMVKSTDLVFLKSSVMTFVGICGNTDWTWRAWRWNTVVSFYDPNQWYQNIGNILNNGAHISGLSSRVLVVEMQHI